MTTASTEDQMKAAATMRNIFAVTGLLVFPTLAILLYNFADIPASRASLVLGVPVLGSALSFLGAAFMHAHRRKLALSGTQAPKKDEEEGGANLLEFVGMTAMFAATAIGSVFLFSDVKASGLAEDMTAQSSAFVISASQPAETMVEAMHGPVKRAVLVPSTAEGPNKGIVCAEARDGTLALYGFGKVRGSETFNKLGMNAELEAAAPEFCKAAFTQLG